jgi:hypothetical protein
LRGALQGYSSEERNRAYSAIREFVVRNPAVNKERLHGFVAEGGHAAAARVIMSFYRPVPQAALFGGSARQCGHCGALLWPDRDAAFADAADVGVDGLAIGIDVKTYASPIVLAARLTRSIGRLELFDRCIIAFPDDKLRLNSSYREQLRNTYQGSRGLEFMTVSDAIRGLGG